MTSPARIWRAHSDRTSWARGMCNSGRADLPECRMRASMPSRLHDLFVLTSANRQRPCHKWFLVDTDRCAQRQWLEDSSEGCSTESGVAHVTIKQKAVYFWITFLLGLVATWFFRDSAAGRVYIPVIWMAVLATLLLSMRCPRCHKSALLEVTHSILGPKQRLWPESICSRCDTVLIPEKEGN